MTSSALKMGAGKIKNFHVEQCIKCVTNDRNEKLIITNANPEFISHEFLPRARMPPVLTQQSSTRLIKPSLRMHFASTFNISRRFDSQPRFTTSPPRIFHISTFLFYYFPFDARSVLRFFFSLHRASVFHSALFPIHSCTGLRILFSVRARPRVHIVFVFPVCTPFLSASARPPASNQLRAAVRERTLITLVTLFSTCT